MWTASQRSGSGSQGRDRWPTHGRRSSSLSAPVIRSPQGAAGGVRRGDALAEVPAGPGEPGFAVEADAGPEVAGYAEDAAPVVGDADVAQVGETAHEEAAQPLGDVRRGHRRRWHAGAPPRRGAQPAPGDAAVGGALAVAQQRLGVLEQLAPGEADPGPGRVVDGLGRDHEVADRQDRPLVALEARGVGLGGPHHDLGPDRPVVGHRPPGLDGADGGAFVDDAAEAFDRRGQPAGEAGRVQRRRVLGEQAAPDAGGVDDAVHLLRA